MREADLEGHFTQSDASPNSKSPGEAGALSDEDSDDVQLDRALEVLKSWNYFDHMRASRPAAPVQAKTIEMTP